MVSTVSDDFVVTLLKRSVPLHVYFISSTSVIPHVMSHPLHHVCFRIITYIPVSSEMNGTEVALLYLTW